jgi:hypothetical protein
MKVSGMLRQRASYFAHFAADGKKIEPMEERRH